MSCLYCGGDFCGSSCGGPEMCENSPTYDEIIKNKPRAMKTAKTIREFMWNIGLRSSSSRDDIEKDIADILKKHYGFSDITTEGNKNGK